MEHKPTIAVMLPGEIFSRKWVHQWTNLIVSTLAGGYDLAPLFGFSSSPHTTRSALMMSCWSAPEEIKIDYVLWVDDDNPPSPEHVQKLLAILQARADVDIAAGWCWIEGDVESGRAPRVSCGLWARDYTQQSFTAEAMELEASRGKLMIAEWTGFPMVLMRYDVLERVKQSSIKHGRGSHPFAGIPGEQFLHGMSGEDIAFCIRAFEGGLTMVVDPTVKVEHLKTQPVADPPKRQVIDLSDSPLLQKVVNRGSNITFSICHTSARPEKWRDAWMLWRKNAAGVAYEYVLCADERWGFNRAELEGAQLPYRLVWNEGRKCAVDGWNTAFRAATGDVLIQASDDVYPPENWDALLLQAIGNLDPLTQDFVIRVNTPNPNQERDLFGPQIISRARYERLGYSLYPEYDCMYSDDDEAEHIKQDVQDGKTILIDARHIMFDELNPLMRNAQWDDVYRHQNRKEAYALGQAILLRRRAARFEPLPVLEEVSL